MKLADLYERYRLRKLRGASKSSLNQFNVTLRLFSRFLQREPTIRDFDNDAIGNFLWSRVEAGRSTATARKNGYNLCALWRFACRQGLMSKWPDVDLPPMPERLPIAWTREQLRSLFRACKSETGYVEGVDAAGWWNGLHAVIWDTGERISAVLSVRWSDVDLAGGWLSIPAENRKGKTRDKSWRLHPDTVSVLEKIVWPERELVFPFRCHVGTLYNRYARLLKSAGLPHDRKHKFHCLRKSVGSYFEAAGGNATELLDHSSRAVTRAYLDPRIVVKEQASDLLFRPGA